jgi:hypothetical protein
MISFPVRRLAAAKLPGNLVCRDGGPNIQCFVKICPVSDVFSRKNSGFPKIGRIPAKAKSQSEKSYSISQKLCYTP